MGNKIGQTLQLKTSGFTHGTVNYTIDWDFLDLSISDNTINTNESTKSPKGLCFGIDNDMGEYLGNNKRVIDPLPYKKYIKRLKQLIEKEPESFAEKPFKKFAYITSKVKSGPVAELDKYLLLLDIDFTEGLPETIKFLKSKNLNFVVIKSSKDRYWIVCDKIGTVSELCEFMVDVPNKDVAYMECSMRQNVLLLRSFPKRGYIPKIGNIEHLKGSRTFINWVTSFKEYWKSKEVEEIANMLLLEAL